MGSSLGAVVEVVEVEVELELEVGGAVVDVEGGTEACVSVPALVAHPLMAEQNARAPAATEHRILTVPIVGPVQEEAAVSGMLTSLVMFKVP